MSIRSVQTKFRASAVHPVLATIDTNSPPTYPHKSQEFDRFYEKLSQPSYSTTTSSPVPSHPVHSGPHNRRNVASASTLSPYASPYKPRSTGRSSQFQAQNQYSQQSQRAGARAGRGVPAVAPTVGQAFDADFLVVKYPQATSPMALGGMSHGAGGSLMDPLLSGVPTYSHTSRFDPFGDFSAPEKASILSIPSSNSYTTFSPPTPPPASTTAFAQSFGTGTGHGPAYTHFYYYDKATNSPTLAYGSQSNKRINYNQSRNQSNFKAKPINTNNHNQFRRSNTSFAPSPSRSPSPPSPSYPRTPSRSPSPPSPNTNKAAFGPSPVAFPMASTLNSATPSEDPFADPVPVPVRTRKRSNTISEVPKAVQVQPIAPSPSPPLPEPKPKVSAKKSDNLASKLVAAMLLNRVDASGRSRCGGSASKRIGGSYVKSGLSRVAWVEC
ncbi:hypothetical protein V5O48_004324 [Marasmius crinis-equi]|uniref:Uncharacterized protein n=1 Tax=Marasmius crinis-equi TaxID=585013 RepID=A0ABR3FQG3_9AGAR